MTLEYRTQVAIVGGGPVGTALSIELARRGIKCMVIERHEQPQRVPKGQNLTQRTMEHFRSWGIESELRAARTLPAEQPAAGMTIYGTVTGEYSYPWLQRERVASYYAAANERLPQYATEAVLRQRLAEFPEAQMLKPWTVCSVSEDGTEARVEMVSATGEAGVVIADYVVGCDGSRSCVREQAGITQSLVDHDRLMVLVVFRSQRFEEIMQRHPGVAFVNVLNPELEGYWQFFGRVDARNSWFFHAPVAGDSTVDSIDVQAALARAVGEPIDVDVEYLGFWDLRFGLADTYRSGRILVAGDAAHSHPPYGGYGINSGFEDVMNLGWKLASVLNGTAGDDLLDSYDAERRPVFASTRDDFIAKSIERDRSFLATFDDPNRDRAGFERAWRAREEEAQSEPGAFEPNYEGSPILLGTGGVPSALGWHDEAARAGHHLAPGKTVDGDEVFGQLGLGFTVLAAQPDSAEPFVAAAARLGLPLRVLQMGPGERRRWAADVVLVRPDQFVAWAGDSVEDAQQVLAVVSGSLGSSRILV